MSPIEMLDKCEYMLRTRKYDKLRRPDPSRTSPHYRRYEATERLQASMRNLNSGCRTQLQVLRRTQVRLADLGLRALALSHRFSAEEARRMALLSGVDDLSRRTIIPAKGLTESLFNGCLGIAEAALAFDLVPPDKGNVSETHDYSNYTAIANTLISATGSEFAGMTVPDVLSWMRWFDLADRDNERAGSALLTAHNRAAMIAGSRVFELMQPAGDDGGEGDVLATLDMLDRFLATTAPLQESAKLLAATARNLNWLSLADEVDPLAEPVT